MGELNVDSVEVLPVGTFQGKRKEKPHSPRQEPLWYSLARPRRQWGGAADGGGGYSRPKRRKSFEVSPGAMPSMAMEVPETVTVASVASRHSPERRLSVT